MNPAGQFGSVRTLPSTLIRRCMTILVTSELVRAYFSLFRRKITKGRHSLSLCGPVDGLGAKTPPNLSNIHAFGACKRFKWCLGPRACKNKIIISIIIMKNFYFKIHHLFTFQSKIFSSKSVTGCEKHNLLKKKKLFARLSFEMK